MRGGRGREERVGVVVMSGKQREECGCVGADMWVRQCAVRA